MMITVKQAIEDYKKNNVISTCKNGFLIREADLKKAIKLMASSQVLSK